VDEGSRVIMALVVNGGSINSSYLEGRMIV
jgi:hypothetical protein